MAITSEIIGKLGVADVESVEVPGPVTAGSNQTLHKVEVAEGDRVLVVFIGRFSNLPTASGSRATLSVGESISKADVTNKDTAVAAILTEDSDIVLAGSSSSTLSGGTVYTVKM